MLVREVIEVLQRRYNLDEPIAVDIWDKSDILEIIGRFDPVIEVSSERAARILAYAERKLNSDIGFNWDSMRKTCLEVIDPMRLVYGEDGMGKGSSKEDELS